MHYVGVLGSYFEKLLPNLKSAPSTFSNYKSHEKIKMPKLETKNALYGYFWVRIFKKLFSYFKLAPSDLSN